MKTNNRVLDGSILALALIFWPSVIGFAEEEHHHGAASADAVSLASIKAWPTEGTDGIVQLNNELCPVSGENVSGKDSFVHEGVNYQICCPMCVGKFKNNLEKYAHSAADVREFMVHQKAQS